MTFDLKRETSASIKFIAAVIVALHHFSQYICANNLSDNIFYKIFSSQGGYVSVAIFFFLSGYGLMESELKQHLNFNDFMRKRLFKIYFPVLLVTVIWLPVIYLLQDVYVPDNEMPAVCWGG